jgi:hypothetical protein
MSMADIVIIGRDGVDLNRLRDLFNHAERTAAPLRFTVDDGTLKVKVGQGTWSPPMGARDPECEAARERPATCRETAVGGDPAWPVRMRCVKDVGHDGRHRDPERGEWRKREPGEDVPLLP